MNISELIYKQADLFPNKTAIMMPHKLGRKYEYTSLSFTEFKTRSIQYSLGFKRNGIKKGMKVLMFVKPSLDFPIITFSLFKIGAIPIFIDPGMGRKNIFKAIEHMQPDAMVSIPKVHLLSKVFKSVFKNIKYKFTTGNSTSSALSIIPWRTINVPEVNKEVENINDHDLAAILFTSGGTGTPKGVEYTHHIFATQTLMLQKLFNLTESDIDLPGFPLFSLFTMSMGMTSVIPDMDPSRPAKVKAKNLVQNILDQKATFIAGSPAIWERVGEYCLKKSIKLESVKYLVMFGAPVSPDIHKMWSKILPNGTTYTPYGATECLPISCISGRELEGSKTDSNLLGQGTCIGRPLEQVQIKVIKQTDNLIKNVSNLVEMDPWNIGEIIVKSEVATKAYFNAKEKTEFTKIPDGDSFWHRMGDMGYIDSDGALWFCGRCAHKVIIEGKIHSPIQSEAIFNKDPNVKRSALIPYNNKSAIIIEPAQSFQRFFLFNRKLRKQLLNLSQSHKKTQHVTNVFFKKSFPVDVRHNIKIDRIKLKNEFGGHS
ncbi:MAG: AMP-binding protein [Bacteriovoracaceae bacterium]|jgi:olefin beta-lactone synthetase|nr:AMP-binding protein [Bacteriovoracaceae bacterium]